MPHGVLVRPQSRAPNRNSSVEALLNICFRGFFHLKETSFLLLISRFLKLFQTNWSFCQESADFIFLPMETSWTRRACICLMTYAIVIVYSLLIQSVSNAFLTSLVPVLGFTFRTISELDTQNLTIRYGEEA